MLSAVTGLVGVQLAGCSSSGGSDHTDALCKMSTAVVGLVVDGLAHDEDISGLYSILDHGGVADAACKSAVRTWRGDPSTTVQFQLVTPAGSMNVDTTAAQLTLVPAQPPATSVQRTIECWAWQSSFMEQLCDQGTINPPQ
jgi:hypothetical protein